ncbi:MAG TPA: PKD domain-containing protein, partial [Thermoanaerobaculia bacterium]
DEQLVTKAPVIVAGTVLATAPVERNGAIWTETTLRVEKNIKGETADTVTIAELGGELGERVTVIYGAPKFTAGQRVLLFLRPQENGQFRTVDLFVGKFDEARMLDGRRLWHRADSEANAQLLDANFQPLEAKNIQRDAVAFEAFIVDQMAGRKAMRNYGVENPVLERRSEPRTRFGASAANFTLLDEPTVFRWSQFDSGTSVRWVHQGTQSGYSGGGVNEVQSAIAAWTSYSGAKILYSHGGAGTGIPGGVSSSNGVNEILFNDPRNDIEGTWSGSGTVGLGGFSGTRGSAQWTAPFTADADHTQRTYSSVLIGEGNLAIQDGVSPSSGISSSKLAEILAHELGHTLGFGHSEDRTALMYAFVTGGGASLKADDQVAARWLYPNGNVAPPPPPPVSGAPAAPTGLGASAGTSSISLTWTDNASNETGQAFYLAIGSGSFGRIGEVGANVRSATLNGVNPGTYRIYVTAFNATGESAASNTVTVTIAGTTTPAPVTAAFDVNVTTGTAAVTTFNFTDQSTGAVASRAWQFGDGVTATSANPSHIYANAGSFTVRLTVTGTNGTTSSATRVVNVQGPFNAAFNWSPANPTTADNIQFSDQSTGGVTSWLWSFGDGTSSGEQNPVKRYNVAGTYSVILTIFRGSESKVSAQSISIAAPSPGLPNVSASFTFEPEAPTSGRAVSFTDTSTGSPDRWQWNFGDGSTSTLKHPVHTYRAPGTYSVSLVAANAGSSSTARRVFVVTNEPYRSLVSATAQTEGLGGSQWRTELSIFNAGSDAANVLMIFIPGAGGLVEARNALLLPKQSITYANALLDVFGLSSGAGAIAIEASTVATSPDLRVSSRTFTNGTIGTYGQAVPDVASQQLGQTLYLTGLAANASYRTNIGLVNRSADPVAATLTLYDGSGDSVATANVTVPAKNFQQSGLASYFTSIAGRSFDGLSLRVVAANADALSAYASMIDNRTQDPVYVQGAAAPTGGSLIVPAVGRAPGANGTFWRSDVTLFNPSDERMLVAIRYLAAGADNRNVTSSSVSLSAHQTVVLEDILSAMGKTAGSGALEVAWTASAGPVVGSRTYTSTEAGGTFGQSIDPIASYGSDVYVAGLRSDTSFRSNVGFVNGGTDAMNVSVELLSSTGSVIGSASFELKPKSQTQMSVAALFPSVDAASIGTFTLRATANAPKLFAYGSIVDNASGDPVFFAGR